MKRVTVLFARKDSIYKTYPECDVFDIDRDARTWAGETPIIAHPPCRAWGSLAHMSNPRPDEKELAIWSIGQIRKWGGVLEHPKSSKLWMHMNLPESGFDSFGGWTLPVNQCWFGHKAEKATKLYIVGCMPWDVPVIPFSSFSATHILGTPGRCKDGSRNYKLPELPRDEREKTPVVLAQWLIDLAQRCAL